MTKVLPASCENGEVTVEGVKIEGTILGAGIAASTGVLILEDDKLPIYFASSAPDIEATLTGLIDIVTDLAASVTTIANTLTAIGTGMTGSTTAPPAALATGVAQLNLKVTAFNTTKTQLEELKGRLT